MCKNRKKDWKKVQWEKEMAKGKMQKSKGKINFAHEKKFF